MKFSNYLACSALSLAVSFGVNPAHAASAASASFSFSVLSTGGFAWSADPVDASSSSSDVSAADFTGWAESAGVFSPSYGPAGVSSTTNIGSAVPSSAASSSGSVTFASAATFTDPSSRVGTLLAVASVPTEGIASATAFSRSYFTLDAGASVTFEGALFLSLSGTNPALPANYNGSDFYGYASGLLAVGDALDITEIGGPGATGLAGSYSLNDVGRLSVSFTNRSNEAVTTYLDSGVTVYSASAIAPIPEPSTYISLLAGLAVVGFVLKRRQPRG